MAVHRRLARQDMPIGSMPCVLARRGSSHPSDTGNIGLGIRKYVWNYLGLRRKMPNGNIAAFMTRPPDVMTRVASLSGDSTSYTACDIGEMCVEFNLV